MDLISILEKTFSSDKTDLEVAQQYLQQAAQQNFPELLKRLSDILKNVANSVMVRTQVGILLKNALYSKDPTTLAAYQQRWMQFAPELRSYIKTNVLETLGSEQTVPSTAAQCVAHIACTEMPHSGWPELISQLSTNIMSLDSSQLLKIASVEAIGYICYNINNDTGILDTQSGFILNAIVHGMRREEPSYRVRIAATNALRDSLQFLNAKFGVEHERDFIMQVICDAAQATDTELSVTALQCLVSIMSLYYKFMDHYMDGALCDITLEAMTSPVDEVALQGIKFWTTVCEEEDMNSEVIKAKCVGRLPIRESRFYAKRTLEHLVSILTQRLADEELESELDDSVEDVSQAAVVCLRSLSHCVGEDIVPHVLQFVSANIENSDWHYREAAVLAFATTVLECPKRQRTEETKLLVDQAMPKFIQLLKDQSFVVRDSTACLIGHVCETQIIKLIIDQQLVNQLVCAMLEGLATGQEAAPNICRAFSNLGLAAFEAATATEDFNAEKCTPETCCLSAYFEAIVDKLLEVAERPDGHQHKVCNAAYEAVMVMVKHSPKDCYETVKKTTLVILERLQQVLLTEGNIESPSDRIKLTDLVSLLYATLQSVVRKVSPQDAPQISDTVMMAVLQMLSSYSGKLEGILENALLTVSSLIAVLQEHFLTYMDVFKPYFAAGLRTVEDHRVCIVAVDLMSDMCHALGAKVLPICDDTMALLLQQLANEQVHRSVKPHILSVFGDIALAIGPHFSKYLDAVLKTLHEASQTQVDRDDPDIVDYLNKLREGCVQAYTGIMKGFTGDADPILAEAQLMKPHVPHLIMFIDQISMDKDASEGLVGDACGLIGDLCRAFGAPILLLVDKDSINMMISKGRESMGLNAKRLANWAHGEIHKFKSAPLKTE